MKLSYLLKSVDIFIQSDVIIKSITTSSLEVKEGALFVAINKGNDYIDDAFQNGASYVICTKNYTSNKVSVVNNSEACLEKLVQTFYCHPQKNIKFIGVTGTNGKTSVSSIIYQMLVKNGEKAMVVGTNGCYINDLFYPTTHTSPTLVDFYKLLFIAQKANVKYVVTEVSSHALSQNRLGTIKWDIAIFTNLTADHLDYHQTMVNYGKAKKRLFDNLSSNAIAIIYNDDPYSEEIIKDCKAKVITVSNSTNSNYAIDKIKEYKDGVSFTVNNILVESKLLGKINAINLSIAYAAISELRLKTTTINQVLGVAGRMEVAYSGDFKVIIDYAHSPDAIRKSIETARAIANRLVIAVFGAGGDRDKLKRPLMGEASSIADIIILTSDNPRGENPLTIINEIKQSLVLEPIVIVNRKEAIAKAINLAKAGDIILILGKGHEKYQIIGKQKYYFSDVETVRKLLL